MPECQMKLFCWLDIHNSTPVWILQCLIGAAILLQLNSKANRNHISLILKHIIYCSTEHISVLCG